MHFVNIVLKIQKISQFASSIGCRQVKAFRLQGGFLTPTGGSDPPGSPLGALPPDPRYRLVLPRSPLFAIPSSDTWRRLWAPIVKLVSTWSPRPRATSRHFWGSLTRFAPPRGRNSVCQKSRFGWVQTHMYYFMDSGPNFTGLVWLNAGGIVRDHISFRFLISCLRRYSRSKSEVV